MRDFWKPMPVSGKLIRELLLLFLLFGVQQSYAQRITRQYNNVSFSAALKGLNARSISTPSTSCMMSWRISG